MEQENQGALAEVLPAPAPAPQAQEVSLMALISRAASDPRVDMDKFERLLAMQEKLELAQERRDFNDAMARAKAKISPVLKNREVDFTSTKGRTNYRYEDFAEVARTVDGPLSEQGLSYRFRADQLREGESRSVRVTCIVSRGGYSEETTLVAFEDHSGNKNNIQAISSTATYLQRATLKLAIGLAAGADDDGQGAGEDGGAISAAEEEEISTLIKETDSVEEGVLTYVGASSIKAMTPKQVSRAREALLRKKQRPANGW
jgi:hypothetical protein